MAKQQEGGISWAHYTFNPWWGCEPCSPACADCYAAAWARRCGVECFGNGKPARFFGKRHWQEPLKWNVAAKTQNTRYRVFCGSMCDIFQNRNDVDIERSDLWGLVESTENLIWMFLTKRPENAFDIIPQRWRKGMPANVWIGATVENQEMTWRIPYLLRLKAALYFISVEPMLSGIDLSDDWTTLGCRPTMDLPDGSGKIGWVIAGGESRLKDRWIKPSWLRIIRDQCIARGIPFHFKQWGQWGLRESVLNSEVRNTQTDIKIIEGERMYLVGKKRAGRQIDGREWLEFPEAA